MAKLRRLKRSGCYKFGAFLFFMASSLYIAGYASPYWSDVVHSDFFTGKLTRRSYSGLWLSCSERYVGVRGQRLTECTRGTLSFYSRQGKDWLIAVLALQTIGLIGMIIASLYCITVNFCKTSCAHSRFLEIVGLISSLCGVVSCAVYIVKTHQAYSLYSWALGLDLGGCSLALLAAAILWCSNPPRGCDTPSYIQPGGPTVVSRPQAPGPALGAGARAPATVVPQGYPPPLVASAESYPPGQLYPDLYQQYAGGGGPPGVLLPTAPPGPYLPAGAQPLDPPPAYSNHGFQQYELHEARSKLRPASAPSYGTTSN